jgi:Tol biopolymer transport system component
METVETNGVARTVRRVSVALTVLGFLAAAPSASAVNPSTVRASLTSTGAQINGYNALPAVSADGRWVTFDSYSDAVVPGDANGTRDVFLRDMQTGQVRLISQKPDGTDANGGSAGPSISADGRYVAFISNALNLGAGTTNGSEDVYVYDRVANTLRRVTTSTTGNDANGKSGEPQVSPDGTHVSFYSRASDLVPGDTVTQDVFVADVATLTIRRVSVKPDGGTSNGASGGADVSNDGRYVSFNSDASDLVVADGNAKGDVFVRDMQTATTTRESVSATGGEANDYSVLTAITADGCLIAFDSAASNLVAGSGGAVKVMVRNRCNANTEVASVSNAGAVKGVALKQPGISDDGCAVVFSTGADIVTPAPGVAAAILRERCQGVTSRLDVSTGGDLGNGSTDQVRISPGVGRYVAFDSGASNLVAGDGNMTFDAFVRDRANAAPPIADLQVAVAGRRVTAEAGGSRDPDNRISSAKIGFGDGSPEESGLSAVHDYARDGTFTVTLVVTDGDDLTATASKTVTVAATGGGGQTQPPGGGLSQPPGGPLGPGKLGLSGGGLSRTRFAVVPVGGRVGGKKGATLTLAVTEAAKLTVRYERAVRGRKAKGTCSRKAKRGKRGTLYQAAGSTTAALRAGRNAIALTGRVGSRALKPGAYRLRLTARTADGRTSQTLTRTLTITRS